MNVELLQKIISLSEARIPFLIQTWDGDFYQGSETYIEGLEDELQEMKDELLSWNRVLLEDELGDVFWDYICLLENLELEGKISKAKVFDRCWTKFSERLNSDGSNNGKWSEVKKMQKERLLSEYQMSIVK